MVGVQPGRTKSVAQSRMYVIPGNLARRNVLTPVSRNTRYSTPENLHDKTATVTVVLDRHKINPAFSLSPKERQ